MRRYTNVTDVSANTLKSVGTGTPVLDDPANSALRTVKSANNKLSVSAGSGADLGTVVLNCAVNLTSAVVTGEEVFSTTSAAPDFKFRRLVAGTNMQIGVNPDTLQINCLVPIAGTVTLASSSANGTSMVGTDSAGLALRVRSMTTSSSNIQIAADATGKEINLRALVIRHLEPTSILGTGPWGVTESRLSVAYKELTPTGWNANLVPLAVPSLYWHGTLVDAVVTPNITLSTAGYFNTILNGLRPGVPFDMYATVATASLTPFKLSFVFYQMAGGLLTKWNAVLASSTGFAINTMNRIQLTTTLATPNGVAFSTETVPRPMLDTNTTSPEGLYATMTQDTTGIYPATGTDLWILGIDVVFG